MLLVILSWVLFRADDIGAALRYMAAMFGHAPSLCDSRAVYYALEFWPELLLCCTAMEKLDNAQLLEVVTAAEELAVKLVSDRREHLALEAFLHRAEEYLRLNVGPKHVTGYLSTYLPDGK